ncbi:lipoprotein [Amycolatopsis minnesotensis]|uniref:Lipoprotein n=1 Tax=Amycolatopsis minnesotensis TaxID=337894 RepID=A0ABN2R6X9_9PSEU
MLTAVTAVVAALSACGKGDDAPPAGEAPPHGYVEGAEEMAEAQSRLIVADRESGAVRVLDLLTERVTEIGKADGVHAVHGDGRYGYLTTVDESVHVVDGGSWMVDHGDHVHYYRAEARDIGPVQGKGLTGAHSDPAAAVLSFADGTTTVLDRARLDKGTVAVTGTFPRAVAVPYREHVLASVADPGHERGGGVEILARDGKPVAAIPEPCPSPAGEAVTRRGVVFGCADGALLVTEQDGVFRGEKIHYPGAVGEDERATEFGYRPGSDTLAARAGGKAVWSLDVSHKNWSRQETGPVVAAAAVGSGGPLLALTADGVLHGYQRNTGAETARVPLLPAEVAGGAPAPAIRVDNTRAYLNNPATGEIHEIDYNDSLRRARTLTVPGKASYVVETGR